MRNKKYNTLVIDPPWKIPMAGKFDRRPTRPQKLPYKTLPIDVIKNMPISKIANKGAHIYLWTTNKYIRDAYDVFDAWGVKFHLMLVGVKPSGVAPNCGYVFGTEFCLLGFFGKPVKKWRSIGKLNWFKMFNKAGNHSTKPDEFYKTVEMMSPAPRIDIFARQVRPGWYAWGNEIELIFRPNIKALDMLGASP